MKPSYKIPTTLDKSTLDMELTIQTKDGIGARPMPIKIILCYIGSILMCFVVITKSFIGTGNLFQIGFFILMWGAITFLLVNMDRTRRMNAMLIPVAMNYFPTRQLLTRTSSPANSFRALSNIESIDENGLVKYLDGTYAYWYRVVGTASVLLFEEDKTAIIERVDSFYRKIGTDCEIIFLTAKESQKVSRQVVNLQLKFNDLTVDDPDLLKLGDEQLNILKHHVGGKFKSIHQYMIIKADNLEALRANKNVIQSEVENSSLMIKQCIELYESDIDSVLSSIYKGEI